MEAMKFLCEHIRLTTEHKFSRIDQNVYIMSGLSKLTFVGNAQIYHREKNHHKIKDNLMVLRLCPKNLDVCVNPSGIVDAVLKHY